MKCVSLPSGVCGEGSRVFSKLTPCVRWVFAKVSLELSHSEVEGASDSALQTRM